jgi:hypothetical protein
MSELLCVWVSRHEPTVLQAQSLQRYRIIQISRRFSNAADIWTTVLKRCGGAPALMVVVLPREWWSPLAFRVGVAAPQTRIVQAVMLPAERGAVQAWSGSWRQLRHDGNQLVFEAWTPEVEP